MKRIADCRCFMLHHLFFSHDPHNNNINIFEFLQILVKSRKKMVKKNYVALTVNCIVLDAVWGISYTYIV
jgi:hypothetical protein